ncbi:MAG: hypothetical protein KC503_32395 [Myxococcales bacterium]|nr:hypothetical protein [Myxococcales bacterium]
MSASLAFALGARITAPPDRHANVAASAAPSIRAPLVQTARIIDKQAPTIATGATAAAGAADDTKTALLTPNGRRVLTWGSCTLAAADTRTAVAAATSVRETAAEPQVAAKPRPGDVGLLPAPTAADERVIAQAARRRAAKRARGTRRTIIVAHDGSARSVMANIRFAKRSRAARDAAKSNLPELPRRADVGRVMQSIRQRVQLCYDRGMVPGSVVLDITIAGASGKVVGSSVSAKSSTADCIERLVERLTFPRFARSRATIRYPYSFQ